MAPRENRQDSYARAARASDMRATGQTWQIIADSEGYPSLLAAKKAVERHRQRNPLGTVAGLRFDSHEGYRITKATLFGCMAEARQRGDLTETIAAARAINDTIDKQCKLMGAHVSVSQQVDVNVTTDPVALLDKLEQALLARDDQRQLQLQTPTIDAEFEGIER
ncbi:hypothetical protein [Mycobacteroides chelonae]|uniref:Uncharacterized protein n=1 Tax=Mycobacteroides chelonae TaxID=1774 RepID=A0A1S1LXF0_MYCCH|nr:hypothetical protein [Mycobacteroides chelonae]OHU77464.1 hypothetical protein BKG84_02700 [Mycobacteroides chelonae]QQG87385.1 hypothetical protein HBA99_09245 [Mycobacteroides chelonae]QQG92201.1 hypothetical protein HBA97_09245 [Mycobacteroides chelonae]